MSVASVLQRALEQNEFTVHYQPIVDLSTGTMVSVEALLRWHHHVRGLVSATEFISFAEGTDLIVEVTESAFRDNVASFEDTLAYLRSVGVGWSIDDFGTGYSLNSHLERFRVDAIKVHGGFVEGVGTEPGDSAIVHAILAMADAFGLVATAGGVETSVQLAHLEKLHCRRAQGFYLARPMPAEALTKLVQESHRWPAA